MIFKEKFFSCYIPSTDQISLSEIYNFIAFTSWDIKATAICVLQLFFNQFVTSWILKLFFLIKPFFLHEQNVKTKIWISWERKELLRSNKKHFSSFFNPSFHWRVKKMFFGRWDSEIKENIVFNNILASYTEF